MLRRGSLGLTEASMAWAMNNEAVQIRPTMRLLIPNSTEAATHVQSVWWRIEIVQ